MMKGGRGPTILLHALTWGAFDHASLAPQVRACNCCHTEGAVLCHTQTHIGYTIGTTSTLLSEVQPSETDIPSLYTCTCTCTLLYMYTHYAHIHVLYMYLCIQCIRTHRHMYIHINTVYNKSIHTH